MSEFEKMKAAIREQYGDEIQRLAEKLGGGWRIEQDIMPVVVLTVVEAQLLEKRLDSLNQAASDGIDVN